MFAALSMMETAALLEEIRGACEAHGVTGSIFEVPADDTLEHELYLLRLELREVFIRKFFEVPAGDVA